MKSKVLDYSEIQILKAYVLPGGKAAIIGRSEDTISYALNNELPLGSLSEERAILEIGPCHSWIEGSNENRHFILVDVKDNCLAYELNQ